MRLVFVRMPGEDEPYAGIWHARYYEAGSKMATQARTGSSPARGDKLNVE